MLTGRTTSTQTETVVSFAKEMVALRRFLCVGSGSLEFFKMGSEETILGYIEARLD